MCVCVCVCVCVFKVVIFWETTKEKALKDAEKFALFCPPLCRYVNTFCFTGAKVRVLFETCKTMAGSLVLEVNAVDPIADACEHFVGDGVEGGREGGHGQRVAEDLYAVAFAAGNVGDVDHRYIHADVAHVGGRKPVHQAVATTIAQMAVQSVGITNGNGGNWRMVVRRVQTL